MTIYLVIFFCSLVFACIANKYRSRRILFYIFSVLTLFPTAFLAGIRNPGVGSDTTTYLTPWWSTFCNIKSFDQLLTMYNGHLFDDLELGYVILNYLTSRVSTSEFAIYFVTNALFSISVLWAIIKSKSPLPFAWCLFLFNYYNFSFNIIRQSISMGFCLLALIYLYNRKLLYVLIFTIMSASFHQVGYITIAILLYISFIVWLSKKYGIKKSASILFSFIIFILLFFNIIISFLMNNDILSMRYLRYFNMEDDGTILTSYVLYYIFIGYIYFYSYKLCINQRKEIFIFSSIHLLGFLLCLSSYITYTMYRLSSYPLLISLVIFLPIVIQHSKKYNMLKYKRLKYSTISLSFLFWLYIIVIRGEHETVPFKSKIIDLILN